MRFLFGGISSETNTFAPTPTGREDFLQAARATEQTPAGVRAQDYLVARALLDASLRDGHELIESICVSAQPSGPTLQHVYEQYRDALLDDIERKGPFDVVFLMLHGAMVATECDDCEGDMIARVREIVGPGVIIGVELDLHCHLTEEMVGGTDVIVLCKEYPHVDFAARAAELYALCARAAAREIMPVPALFDMRMIGLYPTSVAPMSRLLERIRAAEKRPGVLSVSFVHGFPWGDTRATGSRMLVYADRDAALAADVAEELGRMVYAEREALLPRFMNIGAALDQAQAADGLVVLADTADNAGGGAPSDNMTMLRAMLERRIACAAFGCVWDPVAAQTCARAGVGARFALRLGGKSGPASGDPLDAVVTVRAVRSDHDQTKYAPGRYPLGLSVWLEIEGVDVVVTSVRAQTFHPDAFTGLGIDLAGKRVIVVKSMNHYRAGFAPMAEHLLAVATPGAMQVDFATMEYTKRADMNYFPRVFDPLDLGVTRLPAGEARGG